MKNNKRKTQPILQQAPLAIATRIALAAMVAAPVFAAEPAAEKPEETLIYGQRSDGYLDTEMSSPLYTADLLDTARTVNIIDSNVIRDQGADSLSDILSNVPGISMQSGEGGTPAGDQLSIRGFSARTDIFIDGVRDFGGYARDSYLVDRVEVAKGPGSNYTGRGSTGGSINLVSKTAVAENFVNGSAAMGSDAYMRGTVDVNRVINDTTAVRVNVLGHDAEVADRDEVENSRYGFAPTVTFGMGTANRAILSYSYLRQDNVPDYGIPWVPATNTALPDYANKQPPVDDSNWYGMSQRDYENIDNNLATARYEHDFDSGLTLASQLRWGETDRDSLITAPRFNANDSTDVRRTDWKSRDQKDTILNNLTTLSAQFDTGGLQHSTVTGFELSDEDEINYDRDITGNEPVTDLYHPNPNDYWGGDVFRTGGKTESDGLSTSVFAADTVTLNEYWMVTGGLRWDNFDLTYKDTENDGSKVRRTRSDDEVSYQGSVVYKPVSYGSLYAGYGTSFNPSSEGLTLATVTLEDADPEESQSYELGTKWELLDAHLLLNAALFRTEKENARETDPVDTTVTVTVGKQEIDGIELGAVGRLTDAWNILAGVTWMDSEITDSVNPAVIGNEMANTPEYTYNLWTTYQVTAQLQLGVGTQYVDERYSAANNERIAPDYHAYNAMVAYMLTEEIVLRLNGTNLADEDYVGNVGGGHWIPGEGRSVIFSVDYQL